MASCSLKDHSRQAFDGFAPYYDQFTRHHDVEDWIKSLLALAQAHGWSGQRVLDIGCGTGKTAVPLLDRGFEVEGCDHSPAMLAQAQTQLHGRARLHAVDARELPVLGQFDLIIALSDIVNYQLEVSELFGMFRGIAANLAPGSLAIFDANTLWAYGNLWAEHPSADADGAKVSWECVTGPGIKGGGLASAYVHVLREGEHQTNVHYQRHHPRLLIEETLSRAGLEIVDVRGQFPDGRIEPMLDESRHSKAIYLARLRPSMHERR